MIAAIVVPLGSYSIFSTVDCLDDEGADDFDEAVFEAAPDAGVGFALAGALPLVGRFAVRDDLRAVLVDFAFDLLVAIWLSLGINDSIMCCH